MAKRRNIERSVDHKTVFGSVELLNHVGVFCYSHDDSVELSARVEHGNTTHRVELRVTKEGGKALAKRLVEELHLTPSDVGL